jgi:serine/threonine protein kinase
MSDFTIAQRKNRFVNFMKELEKNILRNPKNKKTLSYFIMKELAAGIEGVVYKSEFKRPKYFNDNVAIKVIDIKNVVHEKSASTRFLTETQQELYEMFDLETRDPFFNEIYVYTLTNQLIFQNICPHFIENYTWELPRHEKTFYLFNEFVNGSDMYDFMAKDHSDELWFNILFQLMIGIICYRKYFNMVHSDLHTGNILLQRVKPGGYWAYNINNKTYYLPNLGFVCIINDFGFVWIPEKIQVDWLYKDKLKFLTQNGKEFYDIAYFLQCLTLKYLPKKFRNTVRKLRKSDDFLLVMSSDYPYVNKRYPNNITTDYDGSGRKLIDYFEDLFTDLYGSAPANEELLDTYDMDKNLETKFYNKYLQNLVIEQKH